MNILYYKPLEADMFGSNIIEVAIGIIFVYLLTSIICSAIREGIEGWFKTRSVYLEYGIRELLHDQKAEGIVKSFYNHPLIHGLFLGVYKPRKASYKPPMIANGRNLPSYIPAKNFALALMDLAARGSDTDAVSSDPASPVISLSSIRINILNLRNEWVQRALLTAIDSAQGDLNIAQANIEAWYDSAMDRVSGWYKRSTQWIIFWIGLVVAIGININTITIADFLYRNETARTAIVARAEAAAKDTAFLNRNYYEARKDIEELSLPIGWSEGWGAPKRNDEARSGQLWNNFFGPILGWLLTALAATMGAPFWFDLLNKVMVIRATVKPHEKSPEESSEDRQFPIRRRGAEKEDAPEVIRGFVPSPLPGNISTPKDGESNVDGCDVIVERITSDEDLPAAEGG